MAVVLVATAVLSTAVSSPTPAAAATEIDWYVATPGYIRTDLHTSNVAMHPDGDRLYAVTGDGPERRLLLIDFIDYTVLTEVPIRDGLIWDLAVTADGTAVYIYDQSGIARFDTSTLVETQFIPVAGVSDQLALAPDDPGLLALSRAGRLFRDGIEVDLTGTVLAESSGFGFGSSATEILAIGNGGEPLRVSIAGSSVTLIAAGARSLLDRYGTMGYVDGAIHNWHRNGLTELDLDSLEISSRTSPGLAGSYVFDDDERRVFTFSSNWNWVIEYGSSSFGSPQYTFSTAGEVTPLAAVGDGVVLARESSYGEPGRLIEVDVDVLISGYGDYHAVAPERIVDTRHGIGVDRPGRLAPGETIEFQVAGLANVPATGVLAATMNATVTEPTGSGFVKIWPTGVDRPEVSNVNYTNGQTVANGVTVTLGSDGGLQIYNHAESAAHVLIDVTGYYADASGARGARYRPGPFRVLDTRNTTQGRFGKLGPGEFLDLYVPAYVVGRIVPNPGTVSAVLNVTVANASRFSYVSVVPRGATDTGTSTINFYPGDLRSNMTIAPVSSDGWVRVYNHTGSVDVIVDVIGHYVLPFQTDVGIDQEGRYYPTIPHRRLDTRDASPFDGNGSLTPGSLLLMPGAAGWTDIINLTVTEPTRDGYVTVLRWAGQPPLGPLQTSSVNFVRNQTVANGAYASSSLGYAVANPLGNTHVIVDVFGYLTPERLEPIASVFSPQAAQQRALGGVDGSWDARRLGD